MRIAFVIVSLTVIALALVHLRREEVAMRRDMQRVQSEHVKVRREIWDRQMKIGDMMTPQAIRFRSEVMALEMTNDMAVRVVKNRE
ncbi:hypothetical protein LCGC14_2770940 [marine sediment metagenome]|uniref:Cell division protein FtsL n=1 Tax=marine sediment metagenome TaxID=412755 RepID=A0A0F8YW94_9ZZZZ